MISVSEISGNGAQDFAKCLQISSNFDISLHFLRNVAKCRQILSRLSVKMVNFVGERWNFENAYYLVVFIKFHFETFRTTSLLNVWGRSVAKVCASCISCQELSHEYLLAQVGFDTAESEPLKARRRFSSRLHSPPARYAVVRLLKPKSKKGEAWGSPLMKQIRGIKDTSE